MKTRLSVSAVVSSIVLAACGGGGGGNETKSTASSAPVTTQQATEPVELFATSPTLLPNIKSKYDRLCGRETHAVNVVPVDINKDNRLDLVAALKCLQKVRGTVTNGNVPNMLVALVQDSQGNFTDKTLEVFGEDYPSIDGIAIDYVTNDFNNDSVKDIIFAVNKEDGRLPDNGAVNHKSSHIALMSDGNGRYKIIKLTDPEYGYRVTLKENNLGKQDVVLMPFNEPSAYSYNNGFVKLQGYDWVSNHSSTFFKSISPGLGSTIAIVPSRWPRTGVQLFNGTNNSWTKMGEYKFPEPVLVYMKAWTGDTGLVPMFTIDGKDYVTPSIMDTCELKRTKTGNTEALALFLANEVVGGYKGQVLDDSKEGSLKGVYKLMLFDVNNGNALTKIDLPVSNELTSGVIGDMECPDLNDDGLSDIAYYRPMGGPPVGEGITYPAMLVNDGTGSYYRVADKWFPRPGNGVSHLYEDFNNDGIKDLLYFPLTGYTGDEFNSGSVKDGHPITENRVSYFLYMGKRKLKSSDLVK